MTVQRRRSWGRGTERKTPGRARAGRTYGAVRRSVCLEQRSEGDSYGVRGDAARARSSMAQGPWGGLWVLSSRRREASEGLRRRLARSEICLDKVTPAAVWRMNYKGVKSGSKKSRMGQIRDRRRCPKGTSKRSSQKAKQKSPAPWWTKALWRPGQAPEETPRRVRMGEGRSRAGAGSGLL